MGIGAPEIIIGLIIILVLFGGSQIPKLARNLGKAQQEFKTGLSEGQSEGGSTSVTSTTSTTSPPATDPTPDERPPTP